jgi:hypothetical protein
MHGPCSTILDDPLRALPQRMDLLLDPSDECCASMRQASSKSTNAMRRILALTARVASHVLSSSFQYEAFDRNHLALL